MQPLTEPNPTSPAAANPITLSRCPQPRRKLKPSRHAVNRPPAATGVPSGPRLGRPGKSRSFAVGIVHGGMNCMVPLTDPFAGTVITCAGWLQSGNTSLYGPGTGPTHTTPTCPVKPFTEVRVNWLVPVARSPMLTFVAVSFTPVVAARAVNPTEPRQKMRKKFRNIRRRETIIHVSFLAARSRALFLGFNPTQAGLLSFRRNRWVKCHSITDAWPLRWPQIAFRN